MHKLFANNLTCTSEENVLFNVLNHYNLILIGMAIPDIIDIKRFIDAAIIMPQYNEHSEYISLSMLITKLYINNPKFFTRVLI